MPDFAQAIHNFSIAFIPAFFGIILHEVGHGYAALKQGDPTAKLLGRLTLNPISHIDPVGLLCFVLTSLSGLFVFGWAKPVPINPRYFRNPNKGMMLVSLAGPGVNIALAAIFAILLKLALILFPPELWYANTVYLFALKTCKAGILINLCLAFLNMLPIPPLDGSKVLVYFLPRHVAYKYLSLERYGFLILMALIFIGVLDKIIGPLIHGSFVFLIRILGIG